MRILKLLLFVFILGACKKDDNNTIGPNSFLSDKKFTKLIVEIQFVNGFQPTAGTLSNLTSFLGSLLNKPAGIEIRQYGFSSPGKSAYSLDDIRTIESQHRVNTNSGGVLTVYMFMCDGDYAQNAGSTKVLGMAYGPTSMVLFEKTIRDYSGGLTQPTTTVLETTVSEHEFGHLLGLVNNGTTMINGHQDTSNGKHCNNNNCLMYWLSETSDIVSNLLGNNVPTLDNNCMTDLKHNGGK